MKNRSNFNNLFSHDRKILYVTLCVVMVSVLTLTIVYAALSTTLQINGNAEVSAASWDIYLDNVKLNSQSVTTNIPTILNKTTASFSTTLNKPGDFYEFSIDVVNNGSIDAMIDSITKTPELNENQAKYLNYVVEYQNGEPINNKQLVLKNSYVRLKVRIEFRKDLSEIDLPTQSETLDLSFTVNYVQSDETGIIVEDDGVYEPYKVGDEICIGEECFYAISSDGYSVTMLSKMNITTDDIPKQSSNASPVVFSSTNYWHSDELKVEYGTSYPAYVYDSNSNLYNYVEKYKTYLESQGVKIEESRTISDKELNSLGCVNFPIGGCINAPKWVYSTSYWSGTAFTSNSIGVVLNNARGGYNYNNDDLGIRPVIKVLLSEL